MAKRYGGLHIPYSDHRKIRRDIVRPVVQQIGAAIAVAAGQDVGDDEAYGVEEHVGNDRTRVNVYAKTGEAIHAENGAAPPLQKAAMRVKP